MTDKDRIVAVGLLTSADLRMLGEGFKRAYPVDDAGMFDDLLRAIDEADMTPPGHGGRRGRRV